MVESTQRRAPGGRILRQMRIALLLAVAVGAYAAEPRGAPADYPVHGDTAEAGIGVDYMVHSIPTEEGMLAARHYLVVDIGIFPHKGSDATVNAANFQMIVNGKPLRTPDSAGMVAASIQYPDWEQSRRLEGQAGPVLIGPQQAPGRFPGDPTTPRPLPQPAPDENNGVATPPRLSIDDLVKHATLPEGAFSRPVGGSLCFQFDGKVKKIRTLELVWEPPTGQPVTLKLK